MISLSCWDISCTSNEFLLLTSSKVRFPLQQKSIPNLENKVAVLKSWATISPIGVLAKVSIRTLFSNKNSSHKCIMPWERTQKLIFSCFGYREFHRIGLTTTNHFRSEEH